MTSLTPQMKNIFEKRTFEHISLVKKNMVKMDGYLGRSLQELEERGENHDLSKFIEPERTAYTWIAWQYYCLKNGRNYKFPKEVEQVVQLGHQHHITTNSHHPEYHQDHNAMSNLDLIEMVCDWTAIAQENSLGFASSKSWAIENIDRKWNFSSEKKQLIFKIIDELDSRNSSEKKEKVDSSGLILLAEAKFTGESLIKYCDLQKAHGGNQSHLLPPHFTLLSSVFEYKKSEFVDFIHSGLIAEKRIDFEINSALMMPPTQNHHSWYVFLIPDKGFSRLYKLYNRLILDIAENFNQVHPFIPHITAAAFDNKEAAVKLVSEINSKHISLTGYIDEFKVIEIIGGSVKIVKKFTLGEGELCAS